MLRLVGEYMGVLSFISGQCGLTACFDLGFFFFISVAKAICDNLVQLKVQTDCIF